MSELSAEATGETVGEAKWAALRELERRVPGLDKAAVRFEVLEEGEREDEVVVSCAGDDLGVLIGRHGQTIDSIQYLVNAIVFRAGAHSKPVSVDAAGYRERRRSLLESLALRSAERAKRDGEAVALEPMSPLERRIVHMRLRDVEGVSTRSEGDEPNRHVVVVPE